MVNCQHFQLDFDKLQFDRVEVKYRNEHWTDNLSGFRNHCWHYCSVCSGECHLWRYAWATDFSVSGFIARRPFVCNRLVSPLHADSLMKSHELVAYLLHFSVARSRAPADIQLINLPACFMPPF